MAREGAVYVKCAGATRITKDGRETWIVYFDTKPSEDGLRCLPDTIMVLVDDVTGEAEIFSSP